MLQIVEEGKDQRWGDLLQPNRRGLLVQAAHGEVQE